MCALDSGDSENSYDDLLGDFCNQLYHFAISGEFARVERDFIISSLAQETI